MVGRLGMVGSRLSCGRGGKFETSNRPTLRPRLKYRVNIILRQVDSERKRHFAKSISGQ